jgi:hypothetical protein
MIDYSKWPRKKFLVTSLKLDDFNPRLPVAAKNHTPTQRVIIDYLVDKENAFELAKKIATAGYLINEEPIVCKVKDKYIVLEGNRRVAACKILINPELLKSASKRKAITELLKSFDLNTVKRLEVRVAPDRESADVVIVNRHTDGAAIEKWDKTKQDRFFHNRFIDGESIDILASKFNIPKGSIKDALIRYNLFQELANLDLNDSEKAAVSDETKFNLTNVERFCKSKLGKEFLNIDFKPDGGIKYKSPKKEYIERLKYITTQVISNSLNSRTYGNEKQQQEFVDNIYNTTSFKKGKIADSASDIEPGGETTEATEAVSVIEEGTTDTSSTTSTTAKPKDKKPPKSKLIPVEIVWMTGVERLDNIFKEIKDANLDTQFNGTAVLFRSYLDMIVYQYLFKNNGITEIIAFEHQKLTAENETKLKKIEDFITGLGVLDYNKKELKKIVNLKSGISKDWIPSLKHMLSFLSKSAELLPDARLRQALASYVKGNNSFLDHSDFNLLAHNEYILKDGADLKKVWSQLLPVLLHINNNLN